MPNTIGIKNNLKELLSSNRTCLNAQVIISFINTLEISEGYSIIGSIGHILAAANLGSSLMLGDMDIGVGSLFSEPNDIDICVSEIFMIVFKRAFNEIMVQCSTSLDLYEHKWKDIIKSQSNDLQGSFGGVDAETELDKGFSTIETWTINCNMLVNHIAASISPLHPLCKLNGDLKLDLIVRSNLFNEKEHHRLLHRFTTSRCLGLHIRPRHLDVHSCDWAVDNRTKKYTAFIIGPLTNSKSCIATNALTKHLVFLKALNKCLTPCGIDGYIKTFAFRQETEPGCLSGFDFSRTTPLAVLLFMNKNAPKLLEDSPTLPQIFTFFNLLVCKFYKLLWDNCVMEGMTDEDSLAYTNEIYFTMCKKLNFKFTDVLHEPGTVHYEIERLAAMVEFLSSITEDDIIKDQECFICADKCASNSVMVLLPCNQHYLCFDCYLNFLNRFLGPICSAAKEMIDRNITDSSITPLLYGERLWKCPGRCDCQIGHIRVKSVRDLLAVDEYKMPVTLFNQKKTSDRPTPQNIVEGSVIDLQLKSGILSTQVLQRTLKSNVDDSSAKYLSDTVGGLQEDVVSFRNKTLCPDQIKKMIMGNLPTHLCLRLSLLAASTAANNASFCASNIVSSLLLRIKSKREENYIYCDRASCRAYFLPAKTHFTRCQECHKKCDFAGRNKQANKQANTKAGLSLSKVVRRNDHK